MQRGGISAAIRVAPRISFYSSLTEFLLCQGLFFDAKRRPMPVQIKPSYEEVLACAKSGEYTAIPIST